MKRIYLDNAAGTPVRPEVLEAMMPYFAEHGYNASSSHSEGRTARAALDDARARVAQALGANPKEIIFTSGGTEAANLAIAGAAHACTSNRNRMISLRTEHHAVLHALDALAAEGLRVTLLGVDRDGRVDPAAFAQALDSAAILASVAYVNNEIGTVAPLAELASEARRHGVLFHTDAVAAPLYLSLNANVLGVDLLSLGAHKFCGPKGAGVLYVRQGTRLEPIVRGGPQEFSKRAGTENVAAIVGLAAALDLAVAERENTAARVAELRDAFEAGVLSRVADVRINGGGAARIASVSNLSFAKIGSAALLMRLDLEGIAVSAGSACASGVIEPSHVIAALGLEPEWTAGVVRFTLGRSTTREEIARTLAVLERVVPELRAAGVPA